MTHSPAVDLRPPGGLRGIAGFVGAVFTFVGTMFVLVGGAFGLLARDSGWFALPFVLLGAVFAVLGMLGLGWVIGARLRISPDGTLEVRSVPPWRRRRIALDELARVEARVAGYVSVNRRPARPRVVVRLTDRGGKTTSVDLGAWQQPAALGAIIARAAHHSGADVDEPTRTYLASGMPPLPRT